MFDLFRRLSAEKKKRKEEARIRREREMDAIDNIIEMNRRNDNSIMDSIRNGPPPSQVIPDGWFERNSSHSSSHSHSWHDSHSSHSSSHDSGSSSGSDGGGGGGD
jgi:uncharacterized membrane protein